MKEVLREIQELRKDVRELRETQMSRASTFEKILKFLDSHKYVRRAIIPAFKYLTLWVCITIILSNVMFSDKVVDLLFRIFL